jgi:hypothetical protein
VAALAVSVPLASSSNNHKPGVRAHRNGVFLVKRTYIAPVLEKRAGKAPNSKLSVIIQSNSRFVLNHQVRTVFARSGIKKFKKLHLIDGIAVRIPAHRIADLASI